MAVKMRLKRMGAKKAPFYRVVVADSRSPRDGKFIELIGTYNPLVTPAEIKINEELDDGNKKFALKETLGDIVGSVSIEEGANIDVSASRKDN